MSAERIANLIPPQYRKEILELNMIDLAVAQGSNPSMHYLGVIWKNYVEKEFTGDCNYCYDRVLKNFKAIKPFLIKLEQDSKLLKQT